MWLFPARILCPFWESGRMSCLWIACDVKMETVGLKPYMAKSKWCSFVSCHWQKLGLFQCLKNKNRTWGPLEDDVEVCEKHSVNFPRPYLRLSLPLQKTWFQHSHVWALCEGMQRAHLFTDPREVTPQHYAPQDCKEFQSWSKTWTNKTIPHSPTTSTRRHCKLSDNW